MSGVCIVVRVDHDFFDKLSDIAYGPFENHAEAHRVLCEAGYQENNSLWERPNRPFSKLRIISLRSPEKIK